MAFIAGWRATDDTSYQPAMLALDTVIIDTLANNPDAWAVYLSWRIRMPSALEARLDVRVADHLRQPTAGA